MSNCSTNTNSLHKERVDLGKGNTYVGLFNKRDLRIKIHEKNNNKERLLNIFEVGTLHLTVTFLRVRVSVTIPKKIRGKVPPTVKMYLTLRR